LNVAALLLVTLHALAALLGMPQLQTLLNCTAPFIKLCTIAHAGAVSIWTPLNATLLKVPSECPLVIAAISRPTQRR